MTISFLAPDPCQSTFFLPGGNTPGNGVQVFFYVAGSVNTKQTAYKDPSASVAWSNPIILDSGGNLPLGGEVWFQSGQAFKVVWAPSNDTDPPASPYRTMDNLSGMNDISTTASEWQAGPAPTFISGTSFSLVGDQTGTFQVGRRIRATVTAGTAYGTITASVFGAGITTVTVVNDSTPLDAGLSAVSYGLLSAINMSIPVLSLPGPQGSIIISNSSQTNTHLSYASALNSLIYGYTYQPSGANALAISSGGAMDSIGGYFITTATLTKITNSSWALGSTAGLLDAGVATTGSYFLYTILRPDTGVSDYIGSTTGPAIGPVMPANYTKYRAIGFYQRALSSTVAFHTYEEGGGALGLTWDSPTVDISTTASAARRTDVVKVPSGFSVTAHLNVVATDASNFALWVYCPDQTDLPPNSSTSPLNNFTQQVSNASPAAQMFIRTSSSGAIAARANVSVAAYKVATVGFTWSRRN